MGQSILLPQYAWFNPREIAFAIPDDWQAEIFHMAGYDRPALKPGEIESAIMNPIGMLPLREYARCKKNVAIIFDDMTRATQVFRIAPFILKELALAGISDDQIRFIAAVGTHGAIDRISLAKKLGEEIVRRYPVYNHSPFTNCTYIGTTSYGTRVSINAEVMHCDLKIGIGQITPHILTEFSGGGKLIMPGVSSIDTIEAHHRSAMEIWRERLMKGHSLNHDRIEDNFINADIQEAATLAGLDMKVDCIMNLWGDPVALYAGALKPMYHAAVTHSRSHYLVKSPNDYDIVIANAFTKASELMAAAMNAYKVVNRNGGDVVIIANSPCGEALLYLLRSWGKTIGGKLFKPSTLPPHINHLIIYTEFPETNLLDGFVEKDKVKIFSQWTDVVEFLQKLHGNKTRVAVFPAADVQYSV